MYPWAEENNGALLVDVGGGVGGATLPIVSAFHNLKLQVQDLPENREKFLKVRDIIDVGGPVAHIIPNA